tara:strand:+ start:44 stop:748 length:705 start_codon:yes stop_codon:yes gene_type:complete
MLTIAIVGCSAPGAPHLRTNINDGEGPLIPECQNISSSTIVKKYITDSYLSTWGSAFVEGAPKVSWKGLGKEVPNKVKQRDDAIKWFIAKGILQENYSIKDDNKFFVENGQMSIPVNYDYLLFSSTPYCQAYEARALDVSRAVSSIITLLGNDVFLSDVNSGLFITGLMDRQNSAARWKDRYIITVNNEGVKRTVVKILRELYISRHNGPFNKAISVGHNEAWIMTQISNIVKQ